MKGFAKQDELREEMREKVGEDKKFATAKNEVHSENEKVDLADQVKLEIKAVKDEIKSVRDEVKGDINKLNEKVA